MGGDELMAGRECSAKSEIHPTIINAAENDDGRKCARRTGTAIVPRYSSPLSYCNANMQARGTRRTVLARKRDTEGDEMKTAAPVMMSLSAIVGTEPQNPDPFEPERVGHPEKPNQSLGVDVLEWYHPAVRVRQQEEHERVIHPRGSYGRRSGGSGATKYKCRHWERESPHDT